MKSRLTIVSAFIVLLLLSSCGPRSARTERRAQGGAPEREDAARSADTVSVLDRLPARGEPYRLCSQVLTSEDGMFSAFPERPKELLDETTPIGETCYSPNALCLLENLILCDILRRKDSLAGNGSFCTMAGLSNDGYTHPSILNQE